MPTTVHLPTGRGDVALCGQAGTVILSTKPGKITCKKCTYHAVLTWCVQQDLRTRRYLAERAAS